MIVLEEDRFESARDRSRPLESIHRRQKKLPTRFRNIHSRCQLDFCLPPRLVAPVAVCALGVALRPPHALPTLSPSFYSRSTRAIDTHPPARHPIGAQTLRGARSPRRSARCLPQGPSAYGPTEQTHTQTHTHTHTQEGEQSLSTPRRHAPSPTLAPRPSRTLVFSLAPCGCASNKALTTASLALRSAA